MILINKQDIVNHARRWPKKNMTYRQTPDTRQTDRLVKIGREHAPSNYGVMHKWTPWTVIKIQKSTDIHHFH